MEKRTLRRARGASSEAGDGRGESTWFGKTCIWTTLVSSMYSRIPCAWDWPASNTSWHVAGCRGRFVDHRALSVLNHRWQLAGVVSLTWWSHPLFRLSCQFPENTRVAATADVFPGDVFIDTGNGFLVPTGSVRLYVCKVCLRRREHVRGAGDWRLGQNAPSSRLTLCRAPTARGDPTIAHPIATRRWPRAVTCSRQSQRRPSIIP